MTYARHSLDNVMAGCIGGARVRWSMRYVATGCLLCLAPSWLHSVTGRRACYRRDGDDLS